MSLSPSTQSAGAFVGSPRPSLAALPGSQAVKATSASLQTRPASHLPRTVAALAAAAVVVTGRQVRHTRRDGGQSKRGALCRALTPAAEASPAAEDNVAMVFVKPHACTPETLRLVPQFLEERGLRILRQGSVTSEEVEARGIIDAHYAAIAKIGMARDLTTLGLGAAEESKFEAGYGRSMASAMAAGQVCSAVTAMEVLNVSPSELLQRCLDAGYEKLRSGLYVARLEGGPTGQIYVLNGFYARMRDKFTAPGVVVHWFVVSWSENKLPWSEFRSKVIGATNPVDAVDGSLRGRIRDDWQSLGLKEATNYQDNGVHASAGPLEALRERQVWLGEDPAADPFGQAVSALVGPTYAAALTENPRIEMADGRQGSAFDLLEDLGAQETLEVLASSKLAAD